MVILGGAAYLLGPVFGAVAFILLEEILSGFTPLLALALWHHPHFERAVCKRRHVRAVIEVGKTRWAEPILSIQGLHKSFGGVTATDNVHLDVLDGETHAVIGPKWGRENNSDLTAFRRT